jgi:hypothetical protein
MRRVRELLVLALLGLGSCPLACSGNSSSSGRDAGSSSSSGGSIGNSCATGSGGCQCTVTDVASSINDTVCSASAFPGTECCVDDSWPALGGTCACLPPVRTSVCGTDAQGNCVCVDAPHDAPVGFQQFTGPTPMSCDVVYGCCWQGTQQCACWMLGAPASMCPSGQTKTMSCQASDFPATGSPCVISAAVTACTLPSGGVDGG